MGNKMLNFMDFRIIKRSLVFISCIIVRGLYYIVANAEIIIEISNGVSKNCFS